ncbi:MAG: hypothetical protein HOO97_10795 [Sideroxydans sp.]|nr:hypothetical protein [Sideroxydans sp.]NOT99563.1 hypothetical protein [Sideroxydans sp.]
MTGSQKIRLGDLLVQQQLLTPEQLDIALAQQKTSGLKLGRLLVGNGFITEEQISETLAKQLHIPFINLKFYNINWDVVRRLLVSDARFYRAIALDMRDDKIVVGMTDPTDVRAQHEIAALLKYPISVVVVTEGQLLETFERIY